MKLQFNILPIGRYVKLEIFFVKSVVINISIMDVALTYFPDGTKLHGECEI